MKKYLLLFSLLLPLNASAESSGFLDLYFTPSAKLDLTVPGFGNFEDDGDGFGIRGMGAISESVAFTGEYQSNTYDDFDIDVDTLRFGLGLTGKTGSGLFIEYDKMEFDGEDADGFGLHGRLASKASDTISLYGQIGYLSLKDDTEDITGLEFSLGAVFWINEKAGAFADYRRTNLEGEDSEVEFEFNDLRVGIRISL